MSKKPKQSKKATKSSKRTKIAVQPADEPDTAMTSTRVDDESQNRPTPRADVSEVPVKSQQAEAAPAETVGSGTAPKTTRSEAAKANIKEGLKQHAIAGRPTKAQLILVFGQKGYAMIWAQRTERFCITPETLQAALAKGIPALRLGPGAQTVVEEAKEKP
jgi:hypothetical protein